MAKINTSKSDSPVAQSWTRPLKVDEASLDAFTKARMTDHNVRASDGPERVHEDIFRRWEDRGFFSRLFRRR